MLKYTDFLAAVTAFFAQHVNFICFCRGGNNALECGVKVFRVGFIYNFTCNIRYIRPCYIDFVVRLNND